MLGTVLSLIGMDLKRQVRQTVTTLVLALAGATLIVLALAFGIAVLYEWLKLQYGTLPALGILGTTWAVLGIVFLGIAFLRPKGGRRAMPVANPMQAPAAAIADAADQAMHSAAGVIREGSRSQVFGALVIAALAGFLIGRRL